MVGRSISQWHDLVVGLVERRPDQTFMAACQSEFPSESACGRQPGEQHSGGADDRSARLDHHGETVPLNLVLELAGERCDLEWRRPTLPSPPPR
jgi:hypothetical protein